METRKIDLNTVSYKLVNKTGVLLNPNSASQVKCFARLHAQAPLMPHSGCVNFSKWSPSVIG